MAWATIAVLVAAAPANTGAAAAATVEAHWDVLSGGTYKRAGGYTSDFSPADADNGVWQLFGSASGAPELGFIKLRHTGSGTVEVHWDVLSGGTYRRAGDCRSDFSPGDARNGTWQLFGDGVAAPDLGLVKLRSTPGTIEPHWAGLHAGTYVRAGDYTSDFSPADANNGPWQLLPTGGGAPVLGFVKLNRPPPAPAPPPPPAPPSPRVESGPVAVVVPAPPARRHVRVKVTMSWTWNGRHTRLYRIRFARLPRHGRVQIACHGRGCPRRALSARARRLSGLLRSVEGRRFRAGDRLLITISEPGRLLERVLVRIKDGAVPSARLLRVGSWLPPPARGRGNTRPRPGRDLSREDDEARRSAGWPACADGGRRRR